MHDKDELKRKAAQAAQKPAAIGPDIDLSAFEKSAVHHDYLTDQDLRSVPPGEQRRLVMAGIDVSEKERSGTYFQKDTTVVHCKTRQEGIEVMPIRQALKHQEWIWDYYWKLAAVDADKYTAAAELDLHDGYVIRSLPGAKSIYPIQACLYLDKEGLQQNVHNIIVAEEDSELHIITGCSTSEHLRRGPPCGHFGVLREEERQIEFHHDS
jgi:Fe-S cluster assembly scaffold protein SufB